ncbi:MAG TPA: hypothetical protein IAC82_09285 [Candidatus Merdivicinus intestinigallinarum]|nr:hypothetical protein [Candidatus Merdivicinus intestinigallinarum]
MNMELLIAAKDSGKIWDVATLSQSVDYTTNRTGTPGQAKFSLINQEGISFDVGDVVRFSVDGQLIFYGWIFTISRDRWGVTDITCYDRLRYLKANASYAFYGETAGAIIRQIAEDFNLPLGTIEDTGYALPSLVMEDKTCLDIISEAIQQTLLNTGKIYVFFDDGNGLSLREAGNMKSPVVIGEKSLLTDYTYQRDIDQQTYNSIKLVQPNEETGRAEVYQVEDSETIGKWGLLRLYQKVDEALNPAQITEQAKQSLSYYNRPLNTLKLSSLGVLGLRAGMMLLVNIPGVESAEKKYVLLEKVSHTFENDTHTMDIETMEI